MFDSLQQELVDQVLQPPGSDQRIAAFCQALLTILRKAEEYPDLIDCISRTSSESVPSYTVNRLLRAFQRQLMYSEPTYPRAYITEPVWLESITDIFHNVRKFKMFKADLLEKDVQSNVVERYKAAKLVMSLLQNQLGAAPSMLDIGCSRNHGLKKLKLNLPFKPIKCAVKTLGQMPSAFLDRLLNETLQSGLSLSSCTGMDVVPLSVGMDAAWAKSCSFYPSELLHEATVAEYDYLDKLHLRGVNFVEGDIANCQSTLLNSQKFDVIFLSTLLYQLTPDERAKVRRNVTHFLTEDGIIVYQDYSTIDSTDSSLEFENNWFSRVFPYRTIIEFRTGGEQQLYEMFRWSNGRCETWIPGKDLSAILARTM